tara:strand:+ start:65 stop:580 length:516 start_codon:yes stop_codon:yes gene_type:complete
MEQLITHFKSLDRKRLTQGNLSYQYTSKGVWAGSHLESIFKLFQEIKLDKFKNFLDLGSGDGRVVLIASLFTKASGVEADIDLIAKANKIKTRYKLKADFIVDDFFNIDLSKYDIIYINPDKGFNYGLERKLKDELKGKLLVYNNLFLPRFLKQGKVHLFNNIPIVEFTNV